MTSLHSDRACSCGTHCALGTSAVSPSTKHTSRITLPSNEFTVDGLAPPTAADTRAVVHGTSGAVELVDDHLPVNLISVFVLFSNGACRPHVSPTFGLSVCGVRRGHESSRDAWALVAPELDYCCCKPSTGPATAVL